MRLICILFFISITNQVYAQGKEIMVCGDTQTLIVKQKSNNDTVPEIVWKWDALLAKDLPPAYAKYFRNTDECKSVNNGKQLLLTSSGGGVALINRSDQKAMFYAYVPNAHSAEVLPKNRVIVAGSGSKNSKGNCIELFDMAVPEKSLFKDTLYQAHGVIWDETRQLLYALGFETINLYQLKDWNTDHPTLSKIESIKLPSTGGHELQRYLNNDQLLITNNSNVFVFEKDSKKFNVFIPLKNAKMVKSMSVHRKDKSVLYTIAEESWWTHRVYFLPSKNYISFPAIKVYKAHWIEN